MNIIKRIVICIVYILIAIPFIAQAQTTTNISFQIQVQVTPSQSTTGSFIYNYSISNDASSTQNVWNFNIVVPTMTVSNIQSPSQPHWTFMLSDRGWINWGAFSSNDDIAPGSSTSGFAFQASGLPDVVDSFAQGDVPDPTPVDDVDEQTPPLPDLLQNSVHVLTIGPSAFVFTDFLSAVDRLISLKHRSASLGWLRGEEFIKNLDRHLNEAKEAVSKNRFFEARAQLQAFILMLEEQRKIQSVEQRINNDSDLKKLKPFINDNAFFLLKPNAEFVISRLPGSPEDHHAQDSDRKKNP